MKFLFLILFLLCPIAAFALTPLDMEKAQELFKQEKYEEAQKIYESILAQDPNNTEAEYNLGNTLYRQGKFDEAAQHYLNALNSENSEIREDSLYNLGNTAYRKKDLDSAIKYYEKTLEMNPNNEKAKSNLEFVKKQKEQKQNQQNQQQNSQNQQNQDQQNQQQNQNQQDQQQNSQNQQNQDQQNQDQQNQDQKNQQQQDAKNQNDSKNSQGQEQEVAGKLSPEDAQRIMKSVQDDPREVFKQMIQEKDGKNIYNQQQEDW